LRRPYGTDVEGVGLGNPTLKRGANGRCAYGAGNGSSLRSCFGVGRMWIMGFPCELVLAPPGCGWLELPRRPLRSGPVRVTGLSVRAPSRVQREVSPIWINNLRKGA